MTFDEAMPILRRGKKLQREAWRARGIAWIGMVGAIPIDVPKLWDGDCIILCTSAGDIMTWIPSQKDLLAEDWRDVVIEVGP